MKKINTIINHYAEDKEKYQGAVVPPIYQNTLFTFPSWEAIDEAFDDPINNCIYTRGKNPSVSVVEEKLAKICGGERAKLFSSGMGAISATIMHCIKKGSHVIAVNNIYAPTNNFLNVYLKEKCGLDVTFVKGDKVEEFEDAIKENTALIYLESPGTGTFTLQDLEKIAQLAKKNNIYTAIDNTWATPIFQKPLELGIDFEIHSCSKYIGGHSDVVAGVVIGKEKEINKIFLQEHANYGAKLSPFEGWMLLRSLRTLSMRMERHQANAMAVAKFLEGHPKIKKVMYPGLKSFPQYELGKKQMSGYSGLMGFEINSDNLEDIKKFFNNLKYFNIGVSWGGHESLIYALAISYLKELPEEQFKALGISLGSMRISVGLEDVEDLIEDLDRALKYI